MEKLPRHHADFALFEFGYARPHAAAAAASGNHQSVRLAAGRLRARFFARSSEAYEQTKVGIDSCI
jgi:hypothetical protein